MSNSGYKIIFYDEQGKFKGTEDLIDISFEYSKDIPFNQTSEYFHKLAETSNRAVSSVQLFALALKLSMVRLLYNQYSCPTRKKRRRRIKNLKRKIKKLKLKRDMEWKTHTAYIQNST